LFFNYGRNKDEEKFSFLNYRQFAIISHMSQISPEQPSQVGALVNPILSLSGQNYYNICTSCLFVSEVNAGKNKGFIKKIRSHMYSLMCLYHLVISPFIKVGCCAPVASDFVLCSMINPPPRNCCMHGMKMKGKEIRKILPPSRWPLGIGQR
jgi:hypothetical protein